MSSCGHEYIFGGARVVLPPVKRNAQVGFAWLQAIFHIVEDPADQLAHFYELPPTIKTSRFQIARVFFFHLAYILPASYRASQLLQLSCVGNVSCSIDFILGLALLLHECLCVVQLLFPVQYFFNNWASFININDYSAQISLIAPSLETFKQATFGKLSHQRFNFVITTFSVFIRIKAHLRQIWLHSGQIQLVQNTAQTICWVSLLPFMVVLLGKSIILNYLIRVLCLLMVKFLCYLLE